MRKALIISIIMISLTLAVVTAALLCAGMLRNLHEEKVPPAGAAIAAQSTEITAAPTTEPETEPATEPPTEPTLPEPDFEIRASHAFLYDLSREQGYYLKGGREDRIAIASVTKLLTAYVALLYLPPDTVITAGEEVDWIDEDSTTAYIRPGHQVTVQMCVQGLLMPSGNDAAYVLAVAAGRAIQEDPDMPAQEALACFVQEMNDQAQAVGMKNSHFSNPDGIDAPEHYSCMEDLAILGRLALENAVIRSSVTTPQVDVVYASGQTNSWYNSNALLREGQPYYCEAACGLKTGSTDDAGKCLLSAFQTEEGILLIGVFGCEKNEDRYRDTLQLYSHYTGIPIELPEEETVPEEVPQQENG